MYLRNLRCGIEKCALGFYAAANNVPLGSLCFLYEYARLDFPSSLLFLAFPFNGLPRGLAIGGFVFSGLE